MSRLPRCEFSGSCLGLVNKASNYKFYFKMQADKTYIFHFKNFTLDLAYTSVTIINYKRVFDQQGCSRKWPRTKRNVDYVPVFNDFFRGPWSCYKPVSRGHNPCFFQPRLALNAKSLAGILEDILQAFTRQFKLTSSNNDQATVRRKKYFWDLC